MINGNWMILVSLALRVFSYTTQMQRRPKFVLRSQESSKEEPSNMTDRFKFQVNALLGMYDPIGEPEQDTERSTEHNLVGALLQFPAPFTFTVVGRTVEDNRKAYTDLVQTIVREETGDDTMICEVIPRGSQFTKVTCTASVDSAAMISSVHEALGALEATVMKF